jgi:energy-coupling factor transporter ATP-binding protein EcfA2
VAQALLADPDLLVLDEPSGGMDADGVSRVAFEIRRAAGRRAVVLVARHPTAPLPLPSGVTWRLRDGAVDTRPRDGDGSPVRAGTLLAPSPVTPGTMEVETGDGVVRLVAEAELPAVLRAALNAGQAIRRVQPARDAFPGSAEAEPADEAGTAPRRAGAVHRVLYGAAHRARLLASSQWFLAPAMLDPACSPGRVSA